MRHKILWDFDIETDHLILASASEKKKEKKKKRTCRIVNIAVPADNKRKIKENEKRDKYLDLLRELKISYKTCPWCNGYRRRKWTRRHEFKSWTRLIAFHIALIPLGKVWIQ